MLRKKLDKLILFLHKKQSIHRLLIMMSNILTAKGFDILWLGAAKAEISKCYFELALFLEPKKISAHAGMARVMRYQQQPDVALLHAEKAEVGNPSDYHNLKIKALILRDIGRLSESVEIFKRVVSLEPAGTERVVTELTAQIIEAAVEGRYDDGLRAIIYALPKLDSDSWDPYRLGWWLLKHKGDHPASQLVAVGRFVHGIGKQYFTESSRIISIYELEKKGNVIDDKVLSLNGIIDTFDDVPPVNSGVPHWELNDQRDARITILRAASCVSSKFGTAVLVGDQLVDELSQNDALMILARGVPKPFLIEGRVLNVTFPWGDGFYHFMVEVLPSICAAHEALGAWAFDKYLLCKRIPYQVEILAQLGINEDKLIFSDQFPSVLPSELVVITNFLPRLPFYEAQRWTCCHVRRALSHVGIKGKPGSKRLFIRRGAGTNGRNILNERQLSLILKRNGFNAVYPETLNFPDQVSLYQGADVIVAPAGSALVNIIFCKPGTKVLVLYQPDSTWGMYQSMAEILGIEMHLLFGDKVEPSRTADPDWMKIDNKVDFRVDLPKLENILASLLANS